ncbi:hypothetical protein IEE94_06960 [Yimella sp. cx-573]|nr:hypothetical protein [Yimella sp. cx-573]
MSTVAGSPEELRRAANALNTQAATLEGHASCVSGAQGTASAQWKGAAATEFTCATTAQSRETRRAARVLRDAAGSVRTFAGDLERHQGEQRRLLADLASEKLLLRDLERERQLSSVGDDPLRLSREITATTGRIRRLTTRLDQLGRDHRLAIGKLKAALSVAQPPEVMWRRGATIAGLGWSYWVLWSQGSAAHVLWQTRPGADPTPAQLRKRKDALVTVQKGGASGLAEKDRVKSFLEGKGKWLRPVARSVGAVSLIDAAAPGLVDIWTGGGYSGWRGAATRYMGMVQVNGVVVSRFPGGQVAGGLAIAAWAAWKAGNKTHDNKHWLQQDAPRFLRDGYTPHTFGLSAAVVRKATSAATALHRVPSNATLTPAATAAVAERRLQPVHVPNRSIKKLDTSFMHQGSTTPDRLVPGVAPRPCAPNTGIPTDQGSSR